MRNITENSPIALARNEEDIKKYGNERIIRQCKITRTVGRPWRWRCLAIIKYVGHDIRAWTTNVTSNAFRERPRDRDNNNFVQNRENGKW